MSILPPPLLAVTGERQGQVLQEAMQEFSVRSGARRNRQRRRAVCGDTALLDDGIRVRIGPMERIAIEESGMVKTVISRAPCQDAAQ